MKTTNKTLNVLPYYGNNIEFSQREYLILHMPYSIEKHGLKLIREGRYQEFLNYANEMFDSAPWVGKLSSSSLQQAKYIAIICIALAIRAGIEGGLPEEQAMNLSDSFIQKIDAQTDIYQTYQSMIHFMGNISFFVHETKAEQQYSFPVKSAIDYIYVHLHERITVKELAENCRVTPSYLSALFSKETGQSISEYIMDQKLESARNLLATHQHSCKDLGFLLGFCSQSYFIKCFKTKYGVTPKQFLNNISYQ